MNAGDLRNRISIEARTDARDTTGEPIPTWSALVPGTIRAQKVDLAGREYFAAKSEQSEISTRFRIRYMSGIVASMRVRDLDTDQLYDIESVIDPTGRRVELLLMCKTGVSDGE